MLASDHPFARPSTLPYGLPDFAALTACDFEEGFAAGMAQQRRMLDELAANPEPATVENTLGAWEDARRLLASVKQAFYPVKAAEATPELDALNTALAPRLAEHNNAIFLNRRLYERFLELRRRAEAGEVALDAQDRWALDELIRDFVRSGAALDETAQRRLRELNTRLAELSARCEENIRAARNEGAVRLSASELGGLSEAEAEALRDGDGYRVDLVNTSQHPLLAKLTDRGARRRIYEASVGRGVGGAHDNRALIVEIARARAEWAALLGYPHHAALVASTGVAKTPEAVAGLVAPLATAALAKARAEAEVLASRFGELYPGEEFSAWDWAYVAAIVRREQHGLDEAELTAHLTVPAVLRAVFDAATELYGITFVPRPGLRGHTSEAEVYEVLDADGEPLGAFIADFWARPTKNGGAWMNSIAVQSERYGELPVVTCNCNYSRHAEGLTWSGVITMFHEFGHALHGLLSQVRYPSRSGTAVPRDFVEFPSQVNEHWAWQPGRLLTAETLERLRAAARFGQGFATAEMLMATLLDQSWHRASLAELPTHPDEVEDFERESLESWGVRFDLIPPRYRSAYFSHIWAGGYAAGYYGYLWSQVMDADAVAWFDAQGGGTRANGEHFRRTLLAPGGSVDPAETYRSFRGRDPRPEPLLERLGFTS
ncbi:MAG: M3 family metallopeptidase [Propionibacteriaceae bacterium]|nr:M3 family metallopeptidase [Propionibacteriaceae bacterium]